MKRNITVFGLIASAILTVFLCISVPFMKHSGSGSMVTSMITGYVVMLLAFSLIFVAVKNYRDKFNDGVISFGQAFKIGMGITLIGSAVYVLVWFILYKTFIPDFMDNYAAAQIAYLKNSGASAQKIQEMEADMADAAKIYGTWWGFIGYTLMEIFPVGLVVSLISSLTLMRREKKGPAIA